MVEKSTFSRLASTLIFPAASVAAAASTPIATIHILEPADTLIAASDPIRIRKDKNPQISPIYTDSFLVGRLRVTEQASEPVSIGAIRGFLSTRNHGF